MEFVALLFTLLLWTVIRETLIDKYASAKHKNGLAKAVGIVFACIVVTFAIWIFALV